MRTNLSKTRTAILAASVALTLGLSACGSSDPSTVSAPPAAGSSSSEAVSAQHNDADIAFIQGMSPHHVGALMMAQLAPTRASNADVKALAARIVSGQDPEIKRMQEMATAWGVELQAAGAGAGHSMGGGMSMGMGGEDAKLMALNGAAFDRAFLEMMSAHHQRALPMSQAELDSGENSQAKVLAAAIIKAQSAEIAEMKQLLTEL